MIVQLQRYVIEQTHNIQGRVVGSRYGYAIALRRHWWSRKKYLSLIQDWQTALDDEEKPCLVELQDNIKDATRFTDKPNGIMYSKAAAETIIAMIKSRPDKFILR